MADDIRLIYIKIGMTCLRHTDFYIYTEKCQRITTFLLPTM